MKYGVIADIHSNVVALDETLKKLEELNVNKIICCGDIVGIGPYPEETVQRLMRLKDKFIGVRGNHEDYLLEGLPKEVHDDKRSMSENEINNHLWNHNQLSNFSKVFLSRMPHQCTVEDEDNQILITHYPTSQNGQYKEHIKFPTKEECQELFKEYDANVFLYGHTHTKSIVKEDNKLYINVGSLGCPMNEGVGHCGVLDIEKDKIDYEDVVINYNIGDVIREIKKIKFPMYKTIIDIFFGGGNG
ncbi:MAG: metallophosphoesterase family protein [Clostridia bacterium]|nr:metallophosphoesterase family protein [Clostridia bacterium]